ncbi:MAG: NUDIX hydrolase [Candidatus Taylorbacteria bacterium]
MLYLKKPKDFAKKFDVAACFFECNGEFLILHRHNHKSEGDKWGLPAGKINSGETPVDGALREIYEETGNRVRKENLVFFRKMYVRYPDFDFDYYLFSIALTEKPQVTLSEREHKDSKWVTPKGALSMNLMRDFDSTVRLFFCIK